MKEERKTIEKKEVSHMKKTFMKKTLSVLLSISLLMTLFSVSAVVGASSASVSRVADLSTMDGWRDVFLPNGVISTENAGGVWMDKSVFVNADAFAANGITQKAQNSFLVALSAMAANMSVTGMSHVPTDTVLVLDVSASMGSSQNDVAEELVEAANASITSLLAINKNSRVAVVLSSGPADINGSASDNDAILILPLNRYEATNNVFLTLSNNRISIHESVVLEGTTTKPAAASKAVMGGTYTQKGVILAANHLTAAGNSTTVTDELLGTIQKKPVLVLMSDGSPTFSSTNFQNPTTINLGSGTSTSAAQGFVNQLTAAYAKSIIEAKYGTDCLFYTIGLGVSNDAVAISVLDPDNANSSVAVNNFWRTWNSTAVGGKVTVQSGSLLSAAKTVTKIAGLKQNYVDFYIDVESDTGNVSLGEKLKNAFSEIVGQINLQSRYTPTLVSSAGGDVSGYISFVDKIGPYMAVTDVKGILINNTLYSGADLASNVVSGGKFGTYDEPTELGHEMVRAVRQRFGLASDDEARTLIGLAYDYGQISYKSSTEYSNYIGWYADENGDFLGFYQEGVTQIADTKAAYTIKSYGYLGVEYDSDMMYTIVQVRHNIQTGEETVAFAIPAALIPVITYEVTLDGDGKLSDLKATGAESPIRLVYEVALDSHINEWNVKDVVSSAYLAENTNPDGTINFYTNDWEHSNLTGYHTVNTYSYFNPSRQNDKYYYTEDAPIYTNTSGTLYTGVSAPATNGTYYRAYTVYEKTATALAEKVVYRRLSAAALETAVPTEGSTNWHIHAGNVHVNMDGYTLDKESNRTDTLSVAFKPFVDTHNHSVGDEGYNFYVGATLGNNGRLTLVPQTGVAIRKVLAHDATPTDQDFLFTVQKESGSSGVHTAMLVDSDGTQTAAIVSFNDQGVTTIPVKAGQTIYIGDLAEDEVVTVTETETASYMASVTINGKAAANPAEVTVDKQAIAEVVFVNSDRGTGHITISKEIAHPFGGEYQIPGTLRPFEMTVTLSGIGTQNTEFAIKLSDGESSVVETDEHGQFKVRLAHGETIDVLGLPAGTVVKVVETTAGVGFVPTYWNNGTKTENAYGEVTVMRDGMVSVVVENTYTPQALQPTNIQLGGQKYVEHLDGSPIIDWDDDYIFDVVLERFNKDTQAWEQVTKQSLDKDHKSFTFDMSKETYREAGIYSYRVYEELPMLTNRVEGIVYDQTVHTFSVYVGDENMDGQLDITRVHSEHANRDFEPVNGTYIMALDFTNVQSVEIPASAAIKIQKNLENETGSNRVNLSGFRFELYTDAACTVPATDVADVISIVRNPTDATGEGRIDLVLYQTTAPNAPHVFYLKEVDTDVTGMIYDQRVIKVAIAVKNAEGVNGALEAEISYTDLNGDPLPADAITKDGELVFRNEYRVIGTELPLTFVSKVLTGKDMKANEFTFAVKDLNGQEKALGTSAAAKDGETAVVTFNKNLSFDKAGVYHYTIVETSADGNGVVADKTVYLLIVTVVDVGGSLQATYSVDNAVGNTVVFRNTYTVDEVSYVISGTKELSGRVLLNDEFTFVLTEALNARGEIADGAKTYEARNEYAGLFTFPAITYTEAGTYYYVVTERQNSGSAYGITYDTNAYVVTVTVLDSGNGQLTVEADKDASDMVFRNHYIAAPVGESIDGEKILHGMALSDGQFRFELWQSDEQWALVEDAPIQTVTNGEDGTFAFSLVDYTENNASEFTKAGSYYYIIKEVNGGETIDGITYDSRVYRVRVDIADGLLGQLVAVTNIFDVGGVPQESILFENAYEITGNSQVVLNGYKTLNGEVPDGPSFTFELYETNSEFVVSGTPAQTATQNASGLFAFDLNYGPEDISDTPYYYVVKEANAGLTVDGITYDRAMYTIVVTVEDDSKGGVKTTAVIRKGETVVTSLDFANTYEANDTEIQFTGEKTLSGDKELTAGDFTFVIYEADETFEISGGIASVGTHDENGVITFDAIPLDMAKTYYFVVKESNENPMEDIVYDLSVYHVTVTVADNRQGQLTVENVTYVRVEDASTAEAEGILFENAYLPESDNAQTSDGIDSAIWAALLAICGGAVLTLTTTAKKRRLNEAE